MFNSLRGVITDKAENILCLETGGVEWEIHTTATTLGRLPPVGAEGRVYVYLYHREDALRLYGFAERDERALFFELIKIDGVGPKLAQKILSAITPADFAAAVERGDAAALESLPGVGKKTVQKIVFNLKGRLPCAGDAAGGTDLSEDLVNALMGMGFDRKVSRDAVACALRECEQEGTAADAAQREQAVFKRALAYASKEGRK